MLQDAPELSIIMNMAWIQVVSDRPLKKCSILWYDRKPPPEIEKPNCGGVELINATYVSVWSH